MNDTPIPRAASSSRLGVEQGYMSAESNLPPWTCPNTLVSGAGGTLKTERPWVKDLLWCG